MTRITMTRENVRLSILIHGNPVAILLKSEDFVGILHGKQSSLGAGCTLLSTWFYADVCTIHAMWRDAISYMQGPGDLSHPRDPTTPRMVFNCKTVSTCAASIQLYSNWLVCFQASGNSTKLLAACFVCFPPKNGFYFLTVINSVYTYETFLPFTFSNTTCTKKAQ